jgi:hypothetical protein
MANARVCRALAATVAFAVAEMGSGAAAERPWSEVHSPHFTVVTDAGEKYGRDIAWQFEQVRSVFKVIWPSALQGPERPFVVLVARDEATLRALAPRYFAREQTTTMHPTAVYVSGAETDYVAMRVDVPTPGNARLNPYRTAFGGYADNLMVRHFRGALPQWFRDGFGEILGNTLVHDKDVEIGRVIPWYLEQLTGVRTSTAGDRTRSEDRRGIAPPTTVMLPLPRLVAVTREDPEFTGEADRRMFAAQSWAFVHYLMFGDGGAHRPKLNRFAALLHAGKPGDQATREALGDVTAFTAGFREYLRQPTLQFQRVNVDIDVPRERWPARPLPTEEAAEVRTGFQVAMGEIEGAARPARAATPAPAPAPTKAETAADLIAACNAGDDAACGRLAVGLQTACDAGDAPMCMPLA